MSYSDIGKRQAMRARNKARKLAELDTDENHPRHGTRAGYQDGCRCNRCTAANAAYMWRYRN